MLRLLSLACLVLGVMCVGLNQSPGERVGISESSDLMGGDCYKQKYWLLWAVNCYGGDCRSGGCGCTHYYLDTDPYGHTPNAATPCGTSYVCTAMTTVSTTPCTGGGGGTTDPIVEEI